MAKLVWRVKLIAELGSGIVSETEVARPSLLGRQNGVFGG
jgi:hypothetical protein